MVTILDGNHYFANTALNDSKYFPENNFTPARL